MDTSETSSTEVGSAGRYDLLYETRPPWEIGAPQPALRELAGAGLLRGRVLDAGCGTGEHALLAAALGCDAIGVDLSEVALTQARAKATERGLTARFIRHDLLEPGGLSGLCGPGERFDVVLDCLVFHGFHGEQCARYVDAVASVLDPGGRMFVLCFAEEPPNRPGRVHKVTPAQIRAAFASGWRVDAIDTVTVASALESLPDGLRGWRASATRI